MNLRSLAYRTDLFFPEFEGSVVDRGEYLVITTPDNPGYHWGNFLIFARPPQPGDLERWTDTFSREIGDPQRVGHAVFGVDGTDGEAGAVRQFIDAGYELERNVVLRAKAAHPPPRPNRDVTVRPLVSDADWTLSLEQRRKPDPDGPDDEGYARFMERLMARYRRMSEAGRGHWYGAFLCDVLVADLGLFHRDGVGRYQSVVTLPEFRGLGIAGTLVYGAAVHAAETFDLKDIVIVADDGSQASRVYASVGFEPVELSVGWAKSWEGPP